MAHDHSHHHGAAAGRAGARHARALTIGLGLIVTFLVVQVVTGLMTDSLALLSDAGHMATDALGLAMALAAIRLASSASQRSSRTFGLYRLEILAALANALLLFGVAAYVLFEAFDRLRNPAEIAAVPVLVVGLLGLVVNIAVFLLLRQGAEESINIEGAYLEVVADMLGSIGVVVGALAIMTMDWTWVDPLIGAGIGVFILPRAYRLGREALRILLQEAPADTDLELIASDLSGISGVVDVHDLHVWTLTSEMEVLTAHLMTADGADGHAVLDDARSILTERHGIGHATLQVEPSSHKGCDEMDW